MTRHKKPLSGPIDHNLTLIGRHGKTRTKAFLGSFGTPENLLRPLHFTFSNNHGVGEEYQKYWHLHAKRFKKNERCIPPGSQKTPEMSFKVNIM